MTEMGLTREEVMSLSKRGLREQVALTKARDDLRWRFTYDKEDILIMFDSDGHVERVPDYANDLAAAWELLEEMRREADGRFTLLASATNWRAAPGMVSNPLTDMAQGKTAAEAISRAYLLAHSGRR